MMEHSKVLEEVYTTPGQPGSFMSAEKLQKAVHSLKKWNVSLRSIKNWLKTKDTYTKHRFARKNFPRNPTISPCIDGQWQGDLAEMGNLERSNDGVRYLLIVIDIVSKYVWVEPLKSKHGVAILQGMEKIFERAGRRPEKLQTDDGKEFLDKRVQDYLKNMNIKFFTVKSDKKAAVVERVIRTLKEKIFRYLHEKHTKRYVDVLEDLVKSYNSTYHQSIKMSPMEVTTQNEGQVLGSLYGRAWAEDKVDSELESGMRPKHKEGDYVRVSRVKGVFEKGYWGNWTEEIFIVDQVKSRNPYVVYKLKDWNGDLIKGTFYEHEVQGVDKDLNGYWKVEKVLRSRRCGGRKEYFVKWEGYPSSMNSWVSEVDIKRIRRGG